MTALHVRVSDFSKTYKTRRDEIEAIRAVDMDVRETEFVSILGPSGCGKSTLLMAVGGLLPMSGGRIEIAGQLVTGPRRDTGVVFQSPVLMPWRSILNNVLFPIECLGLSLGEYRRRAIELLEMTDLDKFRDDYPSELSGGMQQRVAICRALIHNPSLLLMDEPFSALDAMTRDAMNQELLRIWEEFKKTVLFVTHSIREAVYLSDRVFVMSPRPAVISRVVDIALPRPRDLSIEETPEFNAYVTELRQAIEG
ncbi:MAG: ABC transporter ATP-binding protein [Rhodospirillales bacterium]|jgi:NitT/TauT family transport system ATP-binding protein|nr:ABC transporter ATP-binding protein [Rhodospirillales bacterium]MDP6773463.1 ABC transporter ATP-binding protein [Rhodospirillales bacterium]